jgi:cardiolipin synthase
LHKYTLLAGSAAFWREAARDMAAARRRLYVQAMTFEADAAGAEVGRAVRQSFAADRRVLVDHFTRFVISDRFVWSPAYLLDRGFRAEVRATYAMFRGLKADGVGVRLTNPMGPLLSGFPFRNHKKLIVADDVAYIGGINFSDHNFAWGDLMLRIEGGGAPDRLAADFVDTCASRATSWTADFGDLKLYGFDGRDNQTGFQEIIGEIEGATHEVCIVSPYLTFPFVDALARAAARGVAVQLITPLKNNKPSVRDYLLRAAEAAGFDVRLTPGMIHLKGLLIDGRRLVLGSSNFDFVSYLAEEELVAVLDDPAVIAAFQTEVIAPALQTALPAGAHVPSRLAGQRSHAALKIAEWVIRRSRYHRRGAADWSY